jgi:uncharacterized repeat protein (TIGR03803 family)
MRSTTNGATDGGSNVSNARRSLGATKLTAAARRGALTLALLSTLLSIAVRPAHAQTETILHKFTGGSDGAEPMGQLTPDGAGNFYGTTDDGGLGFGTVFKLSPDGNGGWTKTVLHAFTDGLDGAYPFFTTLIFDSKGNLYGTTTGGGPDEHGVVFELSPVGMQWEETVLYSTGQDSAGCADPWGGVIMDAAGNFYGQCIVGGFPQTEAIFQLSLSNGVWQQMVIYNYQSPADNNGAGGLTMDAEGNIFAMLSAAYTAPSLVELSPNGNGGWNLTVIHVFERNVFPESVPLLDRAGNIYGTTQAGGVNDGGTVYKLSPGANGVWTGRILYSFGRDKKDGWGPYGGVVLDAVGNIYGTTTAGGSSNQGTVFELTRDDNGSYQQEVLWVFDNNDGTGPLSSLTLDNAGNLYGLSSSGGGGSCNAPDVCGLAFEVSPGFRTHWRVT